MGSPYLYRFNIDQIKILNCRSRGQHNDDDWLSLIVTIDDQVQPHATYFAAPNVHAGGEGLGGPWSIGPFLVNDDQVVTFSYVLTNLSGSDSAQQQAEGDKISFGLVAAVASGIALGLTPFGNLPSAVASAIGGVIGGLAELVGWAVGNPSNPNCNGEVISQTLTFGAGALARLGSHSASNTDTTKNPSEACGNPPMTTVNFSVEKIAQPFTSARSFSVALTPSHLSVFWRGPDGGIGTSWADASVNNGNWNKPSPIAAPNAISNASGISSVARGGNHLDVFWVGPDGGIGTNWFDATVNNGAWNLAFPIAPPGAAALSSGITAVARISSRLDVFWTGPDGGIGTTWSDTSINNGIWNHPFSIAPPNASAIGSGISVVALTPSHLAVFWIGPDGAIGTSWWGAGVNNGNWNTPFPVTPPHASRNGSPLVAVARTPNHIDLFWIRPDGAIATNSWDAGVNNGNWGQPSPITPPNAASITSGVAAVARNESHLDVFWVGPDGGIGTTWWDAHINNSAWNPAFPIAAPNAAGAGTWVSVVARTPDHLDVFWVGPDGGVGTNWFDAHVNNGLWNQAFPIAPPNSASR